MNDSTEITSFKIELHLDATVSINGEAWVKPGASTGITWNNIPSPLEIQMAMDFMSEKILTPTLEGIMNDVIERTKEAKGL